MTCALFVFDSLRLLTSCQWRRRPSNGRGEERSHTTRHMHRTASLYSAESSPANSFTMFVLVKGTHMVHIQTLLLVLGFVLVLAACSE